MSTDNFKLHRDGGPQAWRREPRRGQEGRAADYHQPSASILSTLFILGGAPAKRGSLLSGYEYRLWNQRDLTLNPDPLTYPLWDTKNITSFLSASDPSGLSRMPAHRSIIRVKGETVCKTPSSVLELSNAP